jgi:ABC-type antimicrobial peptide transport system ATPase subunit
MFRILSLLHEIQNTSFNINSHELSQISRFSQITHILLPLYLSDTDMPYLLSRMTDESDTLWDAYTTT